MHIVNVARKPLITVLFLFFYWLWWSVQTIRAGMLGVALLCFTDCLPFKERRGNLGDVVRDIMGQLKTNRVSKDFNREDRGEKRGLSHLALDTVVRSNHIFCSHFHVRHPISCTNTRHLRSSNLCKTGAVSNVVSYVRF